MCLCYLILTIIIIIIIIIHQFISKFSTNFSCPESMSLKWFARAKTLTNKQKRDPPRRPYRDRQNLSVLSLPFLSHAESYSSKIPVLFLKMPSAASSLTDLMEAIGMRCGLCMVRRSNFSQSSGLETTVKLPVMGMLKR